MSRTLPALLAQAATRSPDREVIFPGSRTSWPELAAEGRALAYGLASARIGTGDRVLILLPVADDLVAHGIAEARRMSRVLSRRYLTNDR